MSHFANAHQFYPTPSGLASELIEPYKEALKKGGLVLDPSAGKGSLLKAAIGWEKRAMQTRGYAIEISPGLVSILRETGANVIGSDFLKFESRYRFDFIFMNPPFDSGDKHLLKAWEIASDGCEIACILNAETIRNPFSRTRELLANIISDNGGTVEFKQGAFESAERKTGVEIAIVRLTKPKKSFQDDFDFSGMKAESENFLKDDAPGVGQSIEQADFLDSMVRSARMAAIAAHEMDAAKARFEMYAGVFERWNDFDWERFYKNNTGTANSNTLTEMVKKSAWNWIFNRADLRKFATAKVRENFDKFIAEQKGVEFTRENIEELLSMLHQNRRQIALDCVVEVFDKMTGYAKENRIHYEGWVTNDAWRVNKKVIMPCMARYDSRWGGSWDVYMNDQFKDDIDRAMCLVTGKDVNKIKTIQKVLQCARYGKEKVVVDGRNQDIPHPTLAEKLESEFFIIKVHQKGTAHLTFKNDGEWLEFNRTAAEAKKFPLPKDTHKKR